MFGGVAQAQSFDACVPLIAAAEQDRSQNPYAACGFDDAATAWNKWAPLASYHQHRRALFELCVRHPTHAYADMYCRKAIDLGYAPAMLKRGVDLFKSGMSPESGELLVRALKDTSLTDAERGQVAELLGMAYIKEGPAYDPAQGVALLQKAADARSALANHVMGYFAFSGRFVPQDMKKAMTYFWRAALLGCPAAEENIGLWNLTDGGQITAEQAMIPMQRHAFSCDAAQPVPEELLACACEVVNRREAQARAYPYLLLDVRGEEAILEPSAGGDKVSVRLNGSTPDGSFVSEIRDAAVILLKGDVRYVINRYAPDKCAAHCKARAPNEVAIRPYRLTFTAAECRLIQAYAPQLVDAAGPYVGKKECAGPAPPVRNRAADVLLAPVAEAEHQTDV
ncbi:MAG: hypothetical protein PHX68_02940 [Alphaproteobacteria bacterium]|nr:hypothetical protein [Alphaproteobacteria bacterium]